MEGSRIPSPINELVRRVAERGGAIALCGAAGAAIFLAGVALHETGAGHVFPGRTRAAAASALPAADTVLVRPDAARPLLPPKEIVLAADPSPAPDPAALGPPVILFPRPESTAPPKPARSISAARATAPAKPLIPPAPLPAAISPPPDARSPLPIETDLQPLASPANAPQPDAAPAATTKPPAL